MRTLPQHVLSPKRTRAICAAVALLVGGMAPWANAREIINEHIYIDGPEHPDVVEGWTLGQGSSLTITGASNASPEYIYLRSGSDAWADLNGLTMVGDRESTPNGYGLLFVGVANQVSLRNSYLESTDSYAVKVGGEGGDTLPGEGARMHIVDSTIKGVQRAIMVSQGSELSVQGSTIIAEYDPETPYNFAIQQLDSTVRLHNSSVLGGTNGVGIFSYRNADEQTTNQLYLSNTRVEGEHGAAIRVDHEESYGKPLTADIVIANGSTLFGADGKLISAGHNSQGDDAITLNVVVDNSQLEGDFDFHDRVDSDVTITNGGSLTGRIIGADKLTLSDQGTWRLVEDSAIGDLTMAGGIVDIHGTASQGTWHTLDVAKLSGEGTFAMHADLVSGEGDKLNVSDRDATGNYQLAVQNTGREGGVETHELVSQAGGDAAFSLVGDKVDAGVYTYVLKSSGEAGGEQSWYLERTGEVSPGTEAVIGVHSALPTVWLGEQTALRTRMGELRFADGDTGGAWARTYGSRINARPTVGTGYSQDQWGVLAGADGVVSRNANGHWLVGGMAGVSSNQLRFDTGSRGSIDSHTAGLYATWLGNNGFYVDTVAKYNRYTSEINVRMSDGTPSKGDFASHGFGASVEVGRMFTLPNQWFVEPFAQVAGMWAGGSDFTLDNGMHAETTATRSVLGTLGVNVGKTFETTKGTFRPYAKLAVAHELIGSNSVTVNGIEMKNDISGTRFEVGAGVAAQMAKRLQVYVDGSYSVGTRVDKPWGVNVGARYQF